MLLVHTRTEQVGTQARPASHHLEELDLGMDRFEKDEVHHLGPRRFPYQHVHRDRHTQLALTYQELLDQAVGILRIVIDHPGEVPTVMGIVRIESLLDENRMVVVTGKHDGLAQPVPHIRLHPVLHHELQNLVHGVLVEEPTGSPPPPSPRRAFRPPRPPASPVPPGVPCPPRTIHRT